jgi:epoxyqueuosine reductase
MNLQSKLEEEALSMGAAYFGVANLSLVHQWPITPYQRKLVSKYENAVSIGVPLDTSVVDKIADQNDHIALREYYSHVYHEITPFIDEITDNIYSSLSDEGYSSLPVPASETLDTEKQYSLFSHKMAASLAGLGWIGKSCLLITPEKGPRVRWGTVLTNAPLEAGKPIEIRCGRCSKCVEACPAHAFTGKNFSLLEGRDARMSVQKCLDFLMERRHNIGVSACGQCVYVCPWGNPKGEHQEKSSNFLRLR